MGVSRAVSVVEELVSAFWSIGEVAYAAGSSPRSLRDPYRERVRSDVLTRGFYVSIDRAALALTVDDRGTIRGPNPYERVGARRNDRIHAHLRRTPGNRKLVVVFHCYGVPSPKVMAYLFGLDDLRRQGVDVCTNIMGNHQPGTFPLWPGAGFVRVRGSEMLENLRASVTGARALVTFLRDRYGYDDVTVLGFSIGGQLALHAANAAPVERVIAYAPVTQLHVTMRELGLMRYTHELSAAAMRLVDPGFSIDDLALADPLAQTLGIAPEDLHVVVPKHDRMATPEQIAAIRRRYPGSRMHELDGTHVYPGPLGNVRSIVRDVVTGGPGATR